MKFTRQVLRNTYLRMPEGRRVLDFFTNFAQNFATRDSGSPFYEFVDDRLSSSGYAKAAYAPELLTPLEVEYGKYASFEDFRSDMTVRFVGEFEARALLSRVNILSCELYANCPDFAFPMLFPKHFHLFIAACRLLGVPLEAIPPRNKHIARFDYYFAICKAMHDFRMAHKLSPAETCAAIYGYAECITRDRRVRELPEASRVFMLYASPEDSESFAKDGVTSEETTTWQGNAMMRPGDIGLMYERAPRSCISSVWRMVSRGYDDPFDDWPGKVIIGRGLKIPDIPFSELTKNKVWRKSPLVKAHMQGGSGRTCSSAEYNAILEMAKAADPAFDPSVLPAAPKEVVFSIPSGIKNEQDVIDKLLVPFLKRLGFSDAEIEPQLQVPVGNHGSTYPDFAIRVRERRFSKSAEFVFEAKYSVVQRNDMNNAFTQVVSYGNLLKSSIIAIAAREGVWIWTGESRFDFKTANYYSWEQLHRPDVLSNLRILFDIEV